MVVESDSDTEDVVKIDVDVSVIPEIDNKPMPPNSL
jgi:hypothetical protein